MNKSNIDEMLERADKIIVGLSGGADSVALTHILFLRFGAKKLVACHVNHGIRGGEAERDESFVRSFCHEFQIPLEVARLNIPAIAKQRGIGLEECGREERYKFFVSLCGENSLIATAHNKDDNAETLVLNLCRGTGLAGMGGIPPMRGRIVRPILDMSRREIEEYCRESKLCFVVDSTNGQDDYSRNKVRNRVLPILSEINSSAAENLAAAAALARETKEFIDVKAGELLKASAEKGGISAFKILSQGEFLAKQALCLYLTDNGVGFEKKHIEKLIAALKNGGGLSLPGEYTASVKQNILTVKRENYEDFAVESIEIGKNYFIMGKRLIVLKENLCSNAKINNLLFKKALDCDKIKNTLAVGSRNDGERFKQAGRGVSKTLKKLFNEAKIPAALRDEIIIIRDKDKIAYIEGFGAAEDYAADESTQEYLLIEITAEVKDAQHEGRY